MPSLVIKRKADSGKMYLSTSAYIPDDALGLMLYRWFYTAVTRARKRLYLIAPPEVLLEK